MLRTMMAGALLAFGAGIALAQTAPAPASDNAATAAQPASPAEPASPATPADPANGTAATPAEPATPATAAEPAAPAAKEESQAKATDVAENEPAQVKKARKKMRCATVNVARPSKC